MAVKGPGWRKMTWVVLAWNALCLVWLLAGVASVSDTTQDCAAQHPTVPDNPAASLSARAAQAEANVRALNLREACETGTAVGASLGAAVIVFVWAAGDVILGVVWLVTRPKPGRSCPACGAGVKVGLVVCPTCGWDFRLPTTAPSNETVQGRTGPTVEPQRANKTAGHRTRPHQPDRTTDFQG